MYNARFPLEAKIVILGSQGVGKTSIAEQFLARSFSPNSTSTIGACFMAKKLTIDNSRVSLQIWDTAGQALSRKICAMAPMYYRGAQAALLVYDITSRESFEELHSWVEELRRNMTEELIIVVVANKLDLALYEREVPSEEAREYTTRILGTDTLFYEVSAKEDNGTIEDIFVYIARLLLEQYHPPRILSPPRGRLGDDSAAPQSSCCGF
ncbi:unnamed protein product [Rhizopus stolonifer]